MLRDLTVLAEKSDALVFTAGSNVGRLLAVLAGRRAELVERGRLRSFDVRVSGGVLGGGQGGWDRIGSGTDLFLILVWSVGSSGFLLRILHEAEMSPSLGVEGVAVVSGVVNRLA